MTKRPVARALLRRLNQLDVRVEERDGKLRLNGPVGVMSESIRSQIAQHKTAIISELTTGEAQAEEESVGDHDAFEEAEREAIQWADSGPAEEVDAAFEQAITEWSEITSSVSNADWNWWDQMYPNDLEYARSYVAPPPCPWCGGRNHHNPLCDELRASWEPKIPFGKHRDKRIGAVPRDDLRWLLRSSTQIEQDLRESIETLLASRQDTTKNQNSSSDG